MAWRRGKLTAILLIFEVVFIILFGIFVVYDDEANASAAQNSLTPAQGGADPRTNKAKDFYPMFQDVHVMMFIGFGFLMTFLKRYGFGSVGFNFLVAAFVLQWATLMGGFLHLYNGKIIIDITTLLLSDFAAATVLISMGAVLGKVSHIQLIVMAFVEIIFFIINEWIGLEFFQVVDVGGSMFVHTFGAYFGLSMARVLYREDMVGHSKEGSVYHSDIFSMIGTIFLWLFWPSFNAALAPGDDQHRAIINTYFSLAACAVVTFAISSAVEKDGKINMVHVQNATLAGGVAVGTSADMMVHPWGAMLIGSLAAVLSVVGYTYITPFLADKLKIHDTCGVHNLHGMPGVLAGIIGAIVAAVATTEQYGNSVYQIFPARAPITNSTELAAIQAAFPAIEAGNGRSAGLQAGFQMAALIVTLLIAIVSGALTGLLMRLPIWDNPEEKSLYDDEDYWEIPEEDTAELNGSVDGVGHKKPDSRARAESDNEADTKV